MKRMAFVLLWIVSGAVLSQAQVNWSFKGTVIKMRMADCAPQHGFMATMSSQPGQVQGICPEYTIVGDKVVYVVVGRRVERVHAIGGEHAVHGS